MGWQSKHEGELIISERNVQVRGRLRQMAIGGIRSGKQA